VAQQFSFFVLGSTEASTNLAAERLRKERRYTGRAVGAWYSIGVFAGLGVALGVLLVGLLASLRSGTLIALVVAAAALVGAGFAFQTWKEALAGGIGAACGSLGAGGFVRGALQRGGTRGGTALLVAGLAVVLAGLAFVPALGYLEAVALPVLGARMRARAGRRYEGLRILAKD
jgi:hypothetical protein